MIVIKTIYICHKIPTVDGIEVQCSQTAATAKRIISDVSNAGRNGYRGQAAAIPKRTIPIEVTPVGMVTEVKPVQPENVQSLMEVTPVGMVIEVKPLQPENAYPPMEVTLLGMSIEVKPLQPRNAPPPM